MPLPLLLHPQVSVFVPSCFLASADPCLVMCCNCWTLQADWPGSLFQASLLLLCPCLLAWAAPICLDRVVVAFLVVVVMPVTFQSLVLFDCEVGHAIA
jgi:hypothetical protein